MNVVAKQNAEHYIWGESCDGWRLLNREDLSVIQERVPPGQAEVMHYHERARQLFFILRGTAVMQFETHAVILRTGDSLEIPPGTRHQFKNESAEDVEFLVVSAPTTRGDRIQ